ncbi:MAG: S8 family serine peptidase [Gemmataceae bacterium]|nr:S8 family serine peptidase [Gemmataceae bacterium]
MADGPTVFDELFHLLTPDRLLKDPRATGEGVSVAVIDSGVERSVLEEKFRAAGTPIRPIDGAVFRPNEAAPRPYDGHQSSPHGTTVADIILTMAPKVTLYSADVFGPAGTCEVETVIAALRHAIDVWKVKVVNLSLGVPEHKLQQLPRRQQLHRAIEEAYFRDVLVFAAAHNEHPFTRSYPAAFAPPLISVDKGLFDDPLRFAYRLREHVEFQAHGRGYLGPFAREPATSWATPHLAGIAARILSLKPDLKPFEIKTVLYWLFRASGNGAVAKS